MHDLGGRALKDRPVHCVHIHKKGACVQGLQGAGSLVPARLAPSNSRDLACRKVITQLPRHLSPTAHGTEVWCSVTAFAAELWRPHASDRIHSRCAQHVTLLLPCASLRAPHVAC